MRRLTTLIVKAVDYLSLLQVAVSGAAILAVLGVILWAVTMRYVVRSPMRYSVELPSLLMLLIIALAVAYTQKMKGHVTVNMLTMHLPTTVRQVMEVITGILFLVYITFIAWGTWWKAHLYLTAGIRSHEAGIPMFLFGVLVPIGLAVLGLQVIVDVGRAIGRLRRQSQPEQTGETGGNATERR